MVTSAKSENHGNEGFSKLPRINPKSYYSKMSQNNYTKFLGYSFNNIDSRNGTPPRPPDPKSTMVPRFPGFSIGLLHFCCHVSYMYPTCIKHQSSSYQNIKQSIDPSGPIEPLCDPIENIRNLGKGCILWSDEVYSSISTNN